MDMAEAKAEQAHRDLISGKGKGGKGKKGKKEQPKQVWVTVCLCLT